MITVGPVVRPRHRSGENAAFSQPVKPPWETRVSAPGPQPIAPAVIRVSNHCCRCADRQLKFGELCVSRYQAPGEPWIDGISSETRCRTVATHGISLPLSVRLPERI